MRRLLLLLLALAACSEDKKAQGPAPLAREASQEPAVERGLAPIPSRDLPTPADLRDRKDAAPKAPSPAGTLTPAGEERIALRAYERLLNGRRAATMRIEWTAVERDGRRLVRDVTETRSATVRDMAGTKERFTSTSVSTTLRTEAGELLEMETEEALPGRVDRQKVVRTATGYRVTIRVGVPPKDKEAATQTNEEAFEIAADAPVMVDAEAFLGPKIRAGEATPGATFPLRVLDVGRRRVAEATLKVVGPDDEGPGLKVVESLEEQDTLWWFAEDGSVVRLRAGTTVIRRDDKVRLEDLPRRAASYQITLESNVDLPRLFTTRKMLVDIVVRTDETTKPPRIPLSPFTEVVEKKDDRVTALLLMHDDPKATCPLPIDPKGFEAYLKPTPLMEVDDPEIRELATSILEGDEGEEDDAKDAREAATRIAEFVFSSLRKGSPPLPDPTAKQILRSGTGDCSEHSLLFTTLCRAAGIPARRCSGWVCVGSDWGGHGWCEIWVGRWIGADPTTNEIGTRARYILFSRPDEPETAPGFITAERTRIVIRRAEWEDGQAEFGEDERQSDPAVLSGIRLAALPEGWSVTHHGHGAFLEGPGFTASMGLQPDHGYRSMQWLVGRLPRAKEGGFGGRPAAYSAAMSSWLVSLGRELLVIDVEPESRGSGPPEAELAKVLAPTLDRAD